MNFFQIGCSGRLNKTHNFWKVLFLFLFLWNWADLCTYQFETMTPRDRVGICLELAPNARTPPNLGTFFGGEGEGGRHLKQNHAKPPAHTCSLTCGANNNNNAPNSHNFPTFPHPVPGWGWGWGWDVRVSILIDKYIALLTFVFWSLLWVSLWLFWKLITIYVNSLFTLEKFKLLVKEKLCAGKIAEKNSCRHEGKEKNSFRMF